MDSTESSRVGVIGDDGSAAPATCPIERGGDSWGATREDARDRQNDCGFTAGRSSAVIGEKVAPKVVCVFDVRPVSVNAMYRAVGGRVVMSAVGREFKKEMCAMIAQQDIAMIRGPVSVTLIFSFATRHRRDVDNFAKATLDCLKGVMFEDDSDVYQLHLYKIIGAKADQVYVECESVAMISD